MAFFMEAVYLFVFLTICINNGFSGLKSAKEREAASNSAAKVQPQNLSHLTLNEYLEPMESVESFTQIVPPLSPTPPVRRSGRRRNRKPGLSRRKMAKIGRQMRRLFMSQNANQTATEGKEEPSSDRSPQGRRRHRQKGSSDRRMSNIRRLFRDENTDRSGPGLGTKPEPSGKRMTDEQKKEIAGQSLRALRVGQVPKPMSIAEASTLKRKDWCNTEPLKQMITGRGCHPRTIKNNFCFGQCNSFFIPQVADHPPNGTLEGPALSQAEVAFKSCAFCKPSEFRWVTIKLYCPSREYHILRKRILFVDKCRCQSQPLG